MLTRLTEAGQPTEAWRHRRHVRRRLAHVLCSARPQHSPEAARTARYEPYIWWAVPIARPIRAYEIANKLSVKLAEPLLRIELEETSCWSFDWANSEVVAIGCTNGNFLLRLYHPPTSSLRFPSTGSIAVYDIASALDGRLRARNQRTSNSDPARTDTLKLNAYFHRYSCYNSTTAPHALLHSASISHPKPRLGACAGLLGIWRGDSGQPHSDS